MHMYVLMYRRIDEIGLQTEMYEEPSVIVFIKPLTAPGDVVEKKVLF